MPKEHQALTLYAIGDVVPDWPGPQGEGARFVFTNRGCLLHLHYRRPSPREVYGVRNSPMRVGLVPAGRHTLFLIYDIPQTTNGWSDASFALGLVPPDARPEGRETDKEAWSLITLLTDARTGILHAARLSTMTPFFCTIMEKLVAQQRAALPEFTPAAHDKERRAAYRRWPRPQLMIHDALIWEQVGIPFERL